MKNSAWLAHLLRAGLLAPSFIPDRDQRELRDLVRYRLSLVEDRTRVANRLQQVLEDTNLKVSTVATDLRGKSAQAIRAALLAGESNPAALADLARGRRAQRADLVRALSGQVRDHHRFLLAHLLDQLQFLDEALAAAEERIEAQVAPLPAFVELLPRRDAIPGVNRMAAITILAEIGVDMSRFATSKQLAAWAGMAPGNDATGGKARPTKTRKGNRYLRRSLVQCAHGAARKKDSALRAKYYRLARKRGAGRAAMAVGPAILEIIDHRIARGESYQELGGDDLVQRNAQERIRYLKRELEKLNVRVTIEPVAEAA